MVWGWEKKERGGRERLVQKLYTCIQVCKLTAWVHVNYSLHWHSQEYCLLLHAWKFCCLSLLPWCLKCITFFPPPSRNSARGKGQLDNSLPTGLISLRHSGLQGERERGGGGNNRLWIMCLVNPAVQRLTNCRLHRYEKQGLVLRGGRGQSIYTLCKLFAIRLNNQPSVAWWRELTWSRGALA